MAALDAALRRADQAAEWLGWRAASGGDAAGGRRAPSARGAFARGAGLSLVAPPPIKSTSRRCRGMATRSVATVFGGSGFIGRYVVKRLTHKGFVVRVAVRDPERALFLKPMGAVGQVVPAVRLGHQ